MFRNWIVIIALGVSLKAQSFSAGQTLQDEGRYAEAEASFQTALDQAKTQSDKALALNHLAVVKQIRGDYAAAEILYRQATAICPPDSLELAAILLNQARLCGTQGRFDEAETLCRQALEIHRSKLPPNHPSLADSYDTLGWVQLRRGQFQEAEAAYFAVPCNPREIQSVE